MTSFWVAGHHIRRPRAGTILERFSKYATRACQALDETLDAAAARTRLTARRFKGPHSMYKMSSA
jgi:hypothetical protein